MIKSKKKHWNTNGSDCTKKLNLYFFYYSLSIIWKNWTTVWNNWTTIWKNWNTAEKTELLYEITEEFSPKQKWQKQPILKNWLLTIFRGQFFQSLLYEKTESLLPYCMKKLNVFLLLFSTIFYSFVYYYMGFSTPIFLYIFLKRREGVWKR